MVDYNDNLKSRIIYPLRFPPDKIISNSERLHDPFWGVVSRYFYLWGSQAVRQLIVNQPTVGSNPTPTAILIAGR